MLERIALHQTRLRMPGLSLDAAGVALGARGLVLLGRIDELVGFLAIYTHERSLEDLLPTLALQVVRSAIGAREVALSFAAESSERMDRMADVANLVGGFTFTGTGRHFVQYRDGAAPFGYDVTELLHGESPYLFHHQGFAQAYEVERTLDLKALLLRLMVRVDPRASTPARGPRLVVAEGKLGVALVHYLVRSGVDGEVGIVESPPSAASRDGAPLRRTLFRVPAAPPRMLPLLRHTPGMATFIPLSAGVAVEEGYRHPVELRACPVFAPGGLVLFRGRGEAPLVVDRAPAMGPLSAFGAVALRPEEGGDAFIAAGAPPSREGPDVAHVEARVLPGLRSGGRRTAVWVPSSETEPLRALLYVLPPAVRAATTLAVTDRGAFLLGAAAESLPVGLAFEEIHPGLFLPVGFALFPKVAPAALHGSLGATADVAVFLTPRGHAVAVERARFRAMDDTVVASLERLPPSSGGDDGEVLASLRRVPIEVRAEPMERFQWPTSESGSGGDRS